MKRIISLMLALAIAAGLLPVQAFAAPNVQTTAHAAQTTANDLVAEGSGSFGSLLTQALNAESAEDDGEDYPVGYSVTDLVIEAGVATVTYDTLEECGLVVALYTEDGAQLLASGKEIVYPDATSATVYIEGDIPEYFYAKAFLMDSYDLSPLCQAYETPLYTQEMQKLLKSSVEDYDADKVLTLDGGAGEDFAVYAEDTQVITYQEGVNTVTSMDEENAVYVIENADESITNLVPGAVFSYPFTDGQVLIVKVASIVVEGTTATITGDELTMDEVFEAVRIDASGDTGDLEVDDSAVDEGVTYNGMVSPEEADALYATRDLNKARAGHLGTRGLASAAPTAWDDELSNTAALSLSLDITPPADDAEVEISVVGEVGLKVDFNLKYYLTKSYQKVDVKLTLASSASITITGKWSSGDGIKLPAVKAYPLPGVSLKFTPALVLEVSGEVKFSVTESQVIGFRVIHDKNKWKTKNLSTNPQWETDLKVSGTIFFGFKLTPAVELLEGSLASIEFSGKAGVEIEAEATMPENTETCHHDCILCIDGDVSLVVELGPTVTFLKFWKGGIKLSAKLMGGKLKFADFYFSSREETGQEWAFGKCPYITWLTTVELVDADGVRCADHTVYADNGAEATTNMNGVAELYLPRGRYLISAEGYDAENEEYLSAEAQVTIVEDAEKVQLELLGESDIINRINGILGTVTEEEVKDEVVNLVSEGTCGAEGSNLIWKLYDNGLLQIEGKGAMANYRSSSSGRAPWYSNYRNTITAVQLPEGLTTIGNYAFYGCEVLKGIDIPQGVTSIGQNAFYDCSSLAYANLPDSITTIGSSAFCDCSSLQSVVLPGAMTAIPDSCFSRCTALESVILPENLITLGSYAFNRCSRLQAVNLPEGLTSIGSGAFHLCSALESVNFPESLTTIQDSAFSSSGLKSLVFPANITTVWSSVFMNCTELESVTLAEGCTAVYSDMFNGCTALTTVNLPTTLTEIQWGGFEGCSELTSVNLPEGLTTLSNEAFSCCSNLSGLTLPSTLTKLGESTFNSCSSLTRVSIPSGVTVVPTSCFSSAGLYMVSIPKSVTRMSYGAFANCENLEDVYYAGTLTDWCNIEFWDEWANPMLSGKNLYLDGVLMGSSLTIPDSVTEIGRAVFSGFDHVTSLTVPSHVTAVGECGFYGCTGLRELELPGSVQTLGEGAFAESGLIHMTLNEGTASIGADAFWNCANLSMISLPEGLTTIGESAFGMCTSMVSINLPDSAVNLGEYLLCNCTKLEYVTLPANLTVLPACIFDECSALKTVTLPAGLLTIEDEVFRHSGLVELLIPASVTSIGYRAFAFTYVSKLIFAGSPPAFDSGAFDFNMEALTCYYPTGMGWTDDVKQNYYGNDISWAEYSGSADSLLSSGGTSTGGNTELVTEEAAANAAPVAEPTAEPAAAPVAEPTSEPAAEPAAEPETEAEPAGAAGGSLRLRPLTNVSDPVTGDSSKDQVFGGEYATGEDGVTKTASFTGLVPGEQYVLLAMLSLEAEDPLAPDNLLYITQAAAGEDGTLQFTYLQRQSSRLSYVVACGASAKSLTDAQITVPMLVTNGEAQTADPVVVYDGQTLTEGVDYVVVGRASATEAGEYTCYVRGILNYTGLVQITYTLIDWIVGDLNLDGQITVADALILANHIAQKSLVPDDRLDLADWNWDESVDVLDLMEMLNYITGAWEDKWETPEVPSEEVIETGVGALVQV